MVFFICFLKKFLVLVVGVVVFVGVGIGVLSYFILFFSVD